MLRTLHSKELQEKFLPQSRTEVITEHTEKRFFILLRTLHTERADWIMINTDKTNFIDHGLSRMRRIRTDWEIIFIAKSFEQLRASRKDFTTESHRGVHSPRRVYDSSKEKRFILLLKSRTILINKKLSSQSSQRRTKDAKRTVRKWESNPPRRI